MLPPFPFQNPHQVLSFLSAKSISCLDFSVGKSGNKDQSQIRYLGTIQNSSVPSELSLSVAQTQVMDRRSQDPFQDHLQTEDFFPHVIVQFAATYLEVASKTAFFLYSVQSNVQIAFHDISSLESFGD